MGIAGPLWASLNSSGVLCASLGLAEPLWAYLSLSRPPCASPGLSRLFWASLCLSGQFYISRDTTGQLGFGSELCDYVPPVIAEFTFLLRVLHFSLQPNGLWDLSPKWSHIYISKCFSCIKSKYFSSNFPHFCGSWFQIPPAACLLPEKDFPGFSQFTKIIPETSCSQGWLGLFFRLVELEL